MRMAAFQRVEYLARAGGLARAADLDRGFTFNGDRLPLYNPRRGIFKPKEMRFLLSIKTVFPKPGNRLWYDDQREVHRQIYEGAQCHVYPALKIGDRYFKLEEVEFWTGGCSTSLELHSNH